MAVLQYQNPSSVDAVLDSVLISAGPPEVRREIIVLGDGTGANVTLVAGRVPVDGSGVTQPISGAISFTVPQHVIVDSATLGTITVSFPAAQHVIVDSATLGTIAADVIDRTARLLGNVRIQDGSGNAITSTAAALDVNLKTSSITLPVSIAAAIDISDRAARLLGVVYGSQGQQIKQTAVNFNSQVELAAGATLYDARQIRALTSADVVTAAQGTAAAASGSWPVEVTDGTNILGTVAHPLRVDPTGTTTQPVSGTVSVTGFANPLPVSQSGLWNVNQAIGVAGFEYITDGTNIAAVKAASTAAVAADPSLVIALSPNSPLPVGTNIIGHVIVDSAPSTPVTLSLPVNSAGQLLVDASLTNIRIEDSVGEHLYGTNNALNVHLMGNEIFNLDGFGNVGINISQVVNTAISSPLPIGANTIGAVLVNSVANSQLLASDAFNRADENPLNPVTWATSGTNPLQLVGGLCQVSVPGTFPRSIEIYTGIPNWPNDQYSEITIAAADGRRPCGPVVRFSNGVGYYGQLNNGLNSGTAIFNIQLITASSSVQLATTTIPLLVSPGAVLRLEVLGTTLTLKMNNVVVLTTTDSSIAQGSPGVYLQPSVPSPIGQVSISKWSGGSVFLGTGDSFGLVNAAKETGGNLAIVASATPFAAQTTDLLNRILAQLKYHNMIFAANMNVPVEDSDSIESNFTVS